MRKYVRILLVCVASLFALCGLATQDAMAGPPNYYWVVNKVNLEKNEAVEAKVSTGSTIQLHAKVLGLNATVTCKAAEINNGVLFLGTTATKLLKVGQDRGEVVFTNCSTNVCETVVNGNIKIPATGNADSVLVADKKDTTEVKTVYDDLLPTGKEFTVFTLKGGACGATGLEVKITTPLTRRGLGEKGEGEAGLLGELDSGVAEAKTEGLTHQLTFNCNGMTQLPEKAWDGDVEEITVDRLEFGGNSVCIEGKLTLSLKSKNKFSVF